MCTIEHGILGRSGFLNAYMRHDNGLYSWVLYEYFWVLSFVLQDRAGFTLWDTRCAYVSGWHFKQRYPRRPVRGGNLSYKLNTEIWLESHKTRY